MINRCFIVVAAAAILFGCTITQNVKPVKSGNIGLICIENNQKVLMDGFLPELEDLVRLRGHETMHYTGSTPAGCSHTLKYTANWHWDMAMYLSYAKLDVYQGSKSVGNAIYDARSGGANMNKFGSTRSKIAPLVAQLFP